MIQIQNGIVAFGKSHFGVADDGWNLLEGDGWRVYTKVIQFRPSFISPPNVIASFSALDVLDGANTRIFCRVGWVMPDAFQLQVGTWSDSKIFGATVSWLAIGGESIMRSNTNPCQDRSVEPGR